jgi:hypothetical protein
MLTKDQLNATYDDGAGDGGGDPKPSPSKSGLNTFSGATASAINTGAVGNENVSDYIGYMPEGVYTNRKPIDWIRGENQGVGEQLAKRALDIIPNVASGLMQFFGVAGSLATEWATGEKDYNNPMIQAANAIHNFGGWGDIYRENDDVWGRSNGSWLPSDPGWWIDNAGQLADSAIPFAIGGAGVGAILEKTFMGAADLMSLGATGARVARGMAQLGTSAYMSYAEGAQAGQQVFESVYQKQFQQGIDDGLDPDAADTRAKNIAGSSAATTVQLNTVLGTMLNMSSVAPFFRRSEDVAGEVLKKAIARQAGETVPKWMSRVKEITADQFASKLIEHHGVASYLKEAGQEGFEEWMNQFTQKTGEEEGDAGRTHGFWEQFGQLENWYNRTHGSDDALAAMLGAAGGLANTIAVSHLPTQRTTQFEDGQRQQVANGQLQFDDNGAPIYQKHFASPHNIDKWGTLQAFNSVKDSLASDVEEYGNMQQRYFDAVKKGDPVELDKAKQDMFNPLVFNAVRSGMTDHWTEQFQQIANMSPEEAASNGWDVDYQKQAQKAVSQLNEAQKEYDKLYNKYGLQYEANQGAKQVLDNVFHRKVELMQWDNLITDHEAKLAESRAEEVKQAKLLNPDSYDEHADRYNRTLKTAQGIQAITERDLGRLKVAIDTSDYTKVSDIIQKYRAKGINDEDLPGAVSDLIGKVKHANTQAGKDFEQAQDALYNSTGFAQYKNEHPNETFEDFMHSIQKGTELNQQNLFYQLSIENAKTQQKIAAQQYAEITQEKTLHRFIKKADDWQDKLVKEREAQQAQALAAIQSKAKDKATLDRVSRIELDAMAKRYREQRDAHLATAADLEEQLAPIQKERQATAIYRDPLRANALRRQEKELQRKIEEAKVKAAHFNGLNTQYAVDTTTPEVSSEVAQQQAEKEDETATAENTTDDDLDYLNTILAMAGGEEIEEGSFDTSDETIPEAEPIPQEEKLPEGVLPSAEAYEAEVNSDAYIAYTGILATLPLAVQELMPAFENAIREGTISFNYDLLRPEVKNGTLTAEKAAQALQALKNYIDSTEKNITPDEASNTESGPKVFTLRDIETINTVATPIAAKGSAIVDPELVAKQLTPGDKVTFFAERERSGTWDGKYIVEDGSKNPWGILAILSDTSGWIRKDQTITNGPATEIPEVEVEPSAVPSAVPVDTLPIEVTDSPIIALVDDAAIEQDGYRHMGKKVDDALTVANTTFEQVRDVFDSKLQAWRKEVDKDKINEKYNEDLLRTGYLMPGTRIHFEVDTAYEGDLKDHNSDETDEYGNPKVIGKERFQDYLVADGKIGTTDKHIGNVPIKIVETKTGKTVGYVKTHRFINAKLPNTTDYRNIVAVRYDDKGNRIDVLGEQNKRLLELRKAIVAQFNGGTNAKIGATVKSKAPGSLILNKEQNNVREKLVPGFARSTTPKNSLLPDETLKLGIIHKPPGFKGEVHTSKGVKFTGTLASDQIDLSHGSIVALLPGANGTYHIAQLSGQKLVDVDRYNYEKSTWEKQHAGETYKKMPTATAGAAHAIELYLKHDGSDKRITDEIARLNKETGHDISTAQGLKSFLNQYFTYTQDFKDSQTIATGKGKEQFLFKIGTPVGTQNKGEIKIGWTNSGRKPVAAVLINGKLSPEFVKALDTGFRSRARAVVYNDSSNNLRGINEVTSRKFKDVTFIQSEYDKGNPYPWRHKEHDSYNEYVKSFSKTTVYGRNQLSDGTYNYVANPTLAFEAQLPSKFPTLPDVGAEEVTPLTHIQEQSDEGAFDAFEDIAAWGLNESKSEVEAIGTAPDNSKPLSLATLEEMYNFTPETLRNGRTPLEIYDQLSRTGVTYLSEGYNPFTRCL